MSDVQTLMSKMQDRTAWEDRSRLTEFLAHQLTRGRLAIGLGAGVSVPFGLPNWTELTDRAFTKCNIQRPPTIADEIAAEVIFSRCCNENEQEFAKLITTVLYDDVDLSMSGLRKRELLAAIGALTMASNRGSVNRILTFNFDDLLERFLTYYGFFIESVLRVPAWGSRVDTRVYHIHGFLPSDMKIGISSQIVMTQKHYDVVTGKEGNPWRAMMVDMFRSHTCIFIGLSGNDKNLSSALTDTQTQHAGVAHKDPFWGVRFCLGNDPMISFWENRGVFCAKLENYDQLPSRLFEICQAASESWRLTLAGL